MDSVYENSGFILSTVASDENCSHSTGDSDEGENEREVTPPKCTKVLLIVLSVSLVFALGGLCIMVIMYVSVSLQLSAHETNSTIMVRELTDNYTRVREHLHLYKAFTQSLNCEMNIIVWGGTMYFFSSHKLNWSSSRAFCVSKGTDLVTITSQSEQIFLTSNIKEWYWIGLNDLDTEGRWVWVNNQTLTETGVQFWHKRDSQKSEPDNWKVNDAAGENCAIVKNDVSYSNNWFDVSCNYEMKFICAKKF